MVAIVIARLFTETSVSGAAYVLRWVDEEYDTGSVAVERSGRGQIPTSTHGGKGRHGARG